MINCQESKILKNGTSHYTITQALQLPLSDHNPLFYLKTGSIVVAIHVPVPAPLHRLCPLLVPPVALLDRGGGLERALAFRVDVLHAAAVSEVPPEELDGRSREERRAQRSRSEIETIGSEARGPSERSLQVRIPQVGPTLASPVARRRSHRGQPGSASLDHYWSSLRRPKLRQVS